MTTALPAERLALIIGACLCFFAVAVGAFGAHALQQVLIENGKLAVFETANRYHFYHGLALLVIGLISRDPSADQSMRLIIWLMLAGVVVFSGSLYLLAISGVGKLGAITPLGGLLLLVSWLMLIVGLYRRAKIVK